jgi:hypothetical protein
MLNLFPFLAVLRIRIRRIRTFLGLLDPDPDHYSMDRIRIFLLSSKNSKENFDTYCFVTSV